MEALSEIPLTPLEFARRARRIYPDREAVVDGDQRWSYAEFFERCDRWCSALRDMGVAMGDRVATISPNTHAQLESFYGVPQLGAVLVPINYRLTAEDFVYLLNHSGSRVVCVHPDFLAAVDSIRDRIPDVTHFVSFGGPRPGWVDYESALATASAVFIRPMIQESDLLTINFTSGTTSHPKGVMITHRNAWLNAIGTLVHISMTPADRYLWTLPMFHANGWTFVWIVTAVGGTLVCLPKVDEDGNEVPRDGETVGEIVVRGNVVMKGYFEDPEATAAAFRGGWFHSGDAAVVHADGFAEIRDRLKDVIISGGENISSVELEGIMLRHPAIQEIAVVGLPDAKWGESPHGFVVLKAGLSVTEGELRDYARPHMAGFKVPKGFTFVDELPKTATGKIQKYVLRKGRSAISRQ